MLLCGICLSTEGVLQSSPFISSLKLVLRSNAVVTYFWLIYLSLGNPGWASGLVDWMWKLRWYFFLGFPGWRVCEVRWDLWSRTVGWTERAGVRDRVTDFTKAARTMAGPRKSDLMHELQNRCIYGGWQTRQAAVSWLIYFTDYK